MRSRTHLLALLTVAFFLSGCYTQLQYTQRVHRITDERPSTPGYSWNGDEEKEGPFTEEDSNYDDGYKDGYRKAVDTYPFYYRDYMTANWYARHGFDSHYSYYDPFYDWYYPYGSGFSISFTFGSPLRPGYLAFASPFDYYWYLSHFGYYPHYYHRYYRGFYGSYFGGYYYPSYYHYLLRTGYGYAGYVGPRKEIDRRYGRRSFGTGRVTAGTSRIENNSRNRTGTLQKASQTRRTTVVKSRGNTGTGRSRSVRSRSSSDSRSRVRSTGRSRSGSGSRSSGDGTVKRSGNSRDRGNDNNATRVNGDTDTDSGSRTGFRIDRERSLRNRNYTDNDKVRERLRNSRAPEMDIDKINRIRFENRFNRFRYNFFNTVPRSRTINNSRFPTPSRTKINSSSSNTRSRTRIRSRSSSSSSSRSRSSSSRGNSGSSSKKRSRGDN